MVFWSVVVFFSAPFGLELEVGAAGLDGEGFALGEAFVDAAGDGDEGCGDSATFGSGSLIVMDLSAVVTASPATEEAAVLGSVPTVNGAPEAVPFATPRRR